jgi:1-phosphofructokinase family hexose kinase
MNNVIVTVTPNPAIDRSLVISNYTLGSIHRPQEIMDLAGGKGLNVARTIKRLGGKVHAFILLAGYNGQWIEQLLKGENIPAKIVWGNGETRTCISIIDPQNKLITETYPLGQEITKEIWHNFETGFEEISKKHEWITISGSLPPGAPRNGYSRLLNICKAERKFCFVDTHGDSLKEALKVDPYFVKINASEAYGIVNFDIDSIEKAIHAAHAIRSKGASNVIITLGKIGAVAVSENKTMFASSPPRKTISSVGSGDAFFGGVVLSLSKKESLKKALCQGVASGAANALTIGAGNIDKTIVDAIMQEVVITEY